MKQLLLTSGICAIVFGCATWKDGMTNDYVQLEEYIHEVPGFSKDELFNAVNSYLITTTRSKEFTTDYEDREAGKVTGHMYGYFKHHGRWNVRWDYEIDVKDEKIRCRFSYPEYLNSGFGNWNSIRSINLLNAMKEKLWEPIPGDIIAMAISDSDW